MSNLEGEKLPEQGEGNPDCLLKKIGNQLLKFNRGETFTAKVTPTEIMGSFIYDVRYGGKIFAIEPKTMKSGDMIWVQHLAIAGVLKKITVRNGVYGLKGSDLIHPNCSMGIPVLIKKCSCG